MSRTVTLFGDLALLDANRDIAVQDAWQFGRSDHHADAQRTTFGLCVRIASRKS
jgi:hypothetical protein